MTTFTKGTPRKYFLLATLVLLGAIGGVSEANAHCDKINGPVVTDGREAIEQGTLDPALKWIAAEDEDELHRIFQQTIEVRQESEAARELADRYFFENLVRLHRASENAPYTGLKPADAPSPEGAVETDAALDTGTARELIEQLQAELKANLEKRFDAVLEARQDADAAPEQGRHYVHTYAALVHYVVDLNAAISEQEPHAVEQ